MICRNQERGEQQSGLMLRRTRELLVRQRTELINSLRGQLAEFGLIAPKGVWSIPDLHALAQPLGPADMESALNEAGPMTAPRPINCRNVKIVLAMRASSTDAQVW